MSPSSSYSNSTVAPFARIEDFRIRGVLFIFLILPINEHTPRARYKVVCHFRAIRQRDTLESHRDDDVGETLRQILAAPVVRVPRRIGWDLPASSFAERLQEILKAASQFLVALKDMIPPFLRQVDLATEAVAYGPLSTGRHRFNYLESESDVGWIRL
jgi:hypothetical protein